MDMDVTGIDLEELVQLCAVDNELYCRTFFPNTVRNPFAPCHHEAWDLLESEHRQVNILMFRGAGKTSHCRLYTSKSIAYALSRTILYTGKSEGHAIRSTNWLKTHVENNTQWTEIFKIRQGSKWQDTEFEIIVGPEEIPIWVMAAGITGSIRGLNRNDYRPDLIVLDDVLDDENAHTMEQREKISRLVYGALLESLAPKSEMPHAKIIALNTPQNKEDFAVTALKDPGWASAVFGCWTRATADLPIEFQESAWPERFPSEELRSEKRSAARRNTLATFQREKECKLVSAETSSFKISWLKRYALAPEAPVCIYAIDPVPPPSAGAVEKGHHNKDFEAHVVWGLWKKNFYLLDYRLNRGHEPTWTVATFFELQRRWHPLTTLVETIAYQRVLMWILRKAMEAHRQYFAIEEFNSKSNKFLRIVSGHSGLASSGLLHVRADQVEFLEQFGQYPLVNHDDLLDASSIALQRFTNLQYLGNGQLMAINEDTDDGPPEINIYTAP